MVHAEPHPHAGVRVTVASGFFEGATPKVVDWYDRLTGRPWTVSGIVDARAHRFAFRAAYQRLPLDEEVVVCRFHIGDDALLHDSELGAAAYALSPIEARA